MQFCIFSSLESLHDAIPFTGSSSRFKIVKPGFDSNHYSCRKVISTILVLFQMFAAYCFPGFFVAIQLHSRNPTGINLLQLQLNNLHTLASPTATYVRQFFHCYMFVSQNQMLIRCTLSEVCAVCGLPFWGKSQILACPRVCKSRYGGETLRSPIHCCDVMKPPYLFSGELCTLPLHSKHLFVYTVCCRCSGQCFAVLRTRKSDVILT